MEIIDVSDLASYLRDASVTTESAGLIVELANGIVSDVVGEELDQIPTRMLAVTLEVAARAYRNPQGFSEEALDDWRGKRDAETRQAGVYLTPSERAEILALGGSAIPGIYSVPLGGPDVFR